MSQDFEVVIGLEVHCQLSTESKIFSTARSRLPEGVSVADEAPNANANRVCAGHPGTLPVLNKKAVEYAVRAGLATNCEIRERSVFSRKHYFYPDLPKGYQISQYDLPVCENGWLEIAGEGEQKKRISIQRIHMEEDAGKNLHESGYSLVNLNRAGVPLIEIVTGPDFRSAAEAGAYLRQLYSIVTYLGITDGNLQEGNFRADVNLSVRKRGETQLGTRTEIKNLNSFRFVEKAIEYEASRQIEVVSSGGEVIQETRLFDSDEGKTASMRSKEDAHDYRYFPDPDLLPLNLDPAWIDQIRETLPELPEQKSIRFQNEYGLSDYDAGMLTQSKLMAEFYEKAVEASKGIKKSPKTLANLLTGEVTRLIHETESALDESKLSSQHLVDLVKLLSDNVISSTAAKQILPVLWEKGGEVEAVVEQKGLKQVSDLSQLEPMVEKLIQDHPKQVEEFRSGKEKVLGFFVGQAMKASKGKANPGVLQDLIRKKLGK